MSDTVIKVENLGKKYRIGGIQDKHQQFRDVLVGSLIAPFKRLLNIRKQPPEEEIIWALKNVSFEVKRGEVLGIIGRNGAGKSTLLKILSRITVPTEGQVEMCGRVGSLLEVGTGFHPEMTGRENIYLNGGILGMTRNEIKEKFDEIVEFSGIEKFLDTPVKFYSSGMRVRLAFAVAAHLEPEILMVDEVLAVGDASFQKKCLGKMGMVAKEGRTVLFVSHNLQSINQLCSRTILLNDGRILKDGETKEILNTYTTMLLGRYKLNGCLNNPKLRDPISNPDSIFKWTYISIINFQGEPTSKIRFYEPFKVIFRGHATEICKNILIGFGISSKMVGMIFTSHQIYNELPNTLPEGTSEFTVEIDPNILAPGRYEIGIAAETVKGKEVGDRILIALEFDVLDFGISSDKGWHRPYQAGIIDYPCRWGIKHYLS